jgi:drug/metabolite transporter (DMT)-like permease
MKTNFRAIATCLLAYLCFDIMSVHVRLLSNNYSPQELSVYRNVIGVVPAIFYMWYSKELSLKISDYKIEKWKLGVLRGLIIAVAQLCFYTALAKLELATVSALGQVSALFIVLLAIFIYKEKVGFWRWTAVIIGLLGALMIIRPGSDIFSWYSILPICAAFCYATSIVTLRSFESSTSSAILFLYSAISAAFGAMVLAFGSISFTPIKSLIDGFLITSMAVCGGFGVVFLMYAFRNAPSAVLAPFSYFGILTAFLIGWIVFDEFPIDTLFPGVFLILISGFIIIWRENRKS